MTARDFCYWLQGYFELQNVSEDKLEMTHGNLILVKRHLEMVFKHEIDPSFGDAAKVKALHDIHQGVPSLSVGYPHSASHLGTLMNC